MPQQLNNVLAFTVNVSEIETRINGQLAGRVFGFRLLPTERGLVLKGSACTFHAKQLAQHAVMDATDIPIASNEIDVG
ncbi:MAG TPA: hypothetical protein VFE62_05905 [Gemmataceae bacterium]|nr:hypothetical protein [Gemmataceae bacterium]